jgi:hypothetical protein
MDAPRLLAPEVDGSAVGHVPGSNVRFESASARLGQSLRRGLISERPNHGGVRAGTV